MIELHSCRIPGVEKNDTETGEVPHVPRHKCKIVFKGRGGDVLGPDLPQPLAMLRIGGAGHDSERRDQQRGGTDGHLPTLAKPEEKAETGRRIWRAGKCRVSIRISA